VDRPTWAPPDVDVNHPSPSRVYDYLLGGSHNFAVDREVAKQVLALAPQTAAVAKGNRGFLHRAVRELTLLGIDQFLDIGSGIPTVGNVHETAQEQLPNARVVYVDIDPIAVAHSHLMLTDNPNTGVVHGDLREPDAILSDPVTVELLDFDRPIAVLLVALLHFMSDEDDPMASLARLREVLAPGSYLVISHLVARSDGRPGSHAAHERYNEAVAMLTIRHRDEIAALFAGFTLIEPGLVGADRWRPDSEIDPETDPLPVLAGVGRLDA
jgi:SAM-dependent methyltransferase